MKRFGLFCFYVLCFVFIDMFICRYLLGFGHPRDFSIYKSARPPIPYAEFTSTKLKQETSLDKIKFWNSKDKNTIKVAFFGGSTGMPVKEKLFSEKLSQLFRQNVEVVNFSMYSGIHTQHLHLLLEILHNDIPDIVVFYGGRNETIQQGHFDPRPGYTYSYYYRAELSPLKKLLIENSALFGALESKFGILSHINELRNEYKPFSKEWNDSVVNKYFENLALTKRVAESLPSSKYGKTKFIAFYQPYRSELYPEFYEYHKLIRDKIKDIDYIIDIHDLYDVFDKNIYFDDCHVEDIATDLLVETMAAKIAEKFYEESN